MASWAEVIALSDFQYSGVGQSLAFTSKPGTYFWSNGSAWGLCEVPSAGATLEVLKGRLDLKSFTLKGKGPKKFKTLHIGEGEKKTI